MPDRIRTIPHAPEGIPDCGSFEVAPLGQLISSPAA